jgi:hypothetical protein
MTDDMRGEPRPVDRGRTAESRVAALFAGAGWKVSRPPDEPGADLIVRRKGLEYVVEVKSASEGRGDRLVPLFAQAVLEASQAASGKSVPLGVVAAPRVSERAARQVIAFAQRYAPNAGAGVIDFEGLALFSGPQLEELSASAREVPGLVRRALPDSGALFSDLNQWMLKVLIAPDVPEAILSAPRGRYGNASQLARAANVSVMSAFRFVQQFQREGYLHEGGPYLRLVRREDLFARWQALSFHPPREVPMRFLLRGDPQVHLRRILASGPACLALFAAADALGMGFVSGVPRYVYVDRIQPARLAAWKNLRPCSPGEPPDLILRQAPAPRSVFRGLVRPGGLPVCDVLQVWLDVASHPSRGREQAELIRKRALRRVIENGE